MSYFQQRKFDPFDFAYGLTVHKAQGSRWENVTILDEADVFGKHARRWLYTAITRAADRLTLVLSDCIIREHYNKALQAMRASPELKLELGCGRSDEGVRVKKFDRAEEDGAAEATVATNHPVS